MQTGITVSTSDPNFPKSVTRILQHSILQLCNEHIGYNHTLQVLGVLCLTIDDKQQELVVKVNNTLKRVNPVTPPKDAAFQPPAVPRVDQELCYPASDVPLMLEGGCPNGAFTANSDERKESRMQDSPGGSSLSKSDRKAHGRKQMNPVRVKHVYDEGDGGEYSDGDVLTVEPTNPESPFDAERKSHGQISSPEDGVSQSSPKRIGGIRKTKRRLNDVFSALSNDSAAATGNAALIAQMASCDNRGASIASTPRQSPNGAKRSYEETIEKINGCNDSGDDSRDSGCSQRLVVIAPDFSGLENPDDMGSSVAETGALNFSMCALNGGTPRPGKVDDGNVSAGMPVASPAQEFPNGDLNGIRIKEEIKGSYHQGLDLVMNSNSYDVSQNLAIRTSFLNDPCFLPAALTNGHVAAQVSLPSASNSALRYPGLQLFDEAYLHSMVNGFSVAQVAVGPASYTISSCLKDGLTMHLTKTRGKDRASGTSMKVKDIIMYDDSAPLHTQKGSKIEGDFMLDSLNVEGKKRRRRTAEDALTSEEIAEYMGSCDRGQCSFKCKYCNETCPDLSRYFNHTLLKHNAFICHQCGKNFTTKSSLLRHRPIHTGMRRFACSICKKSFYRKDKCKAHIKRHLGLSSDSPEKYPPANVAAS